jgi:regulator of ribonuclease activity A
MRPTADLCDEFSDDVQVLEPSLRAYGGMTSFAGTVTTLKVFEDNALVRAALEARGEGQVLVVDGGASVRCALLGAKLGQLAERHRWTGVIVWGAVRDVEELRQCGVGICALASTPRKSAKKGTGERDVPVTIGGVTIQPGAWLAADADGIIIAARPLA